MKKLLMLATVAIISSMSYSCKKSTTCTENIKSNCICTHEYDPVCGCNNKTYGNACSAGCAGITEYTKGECK